MAAPDDDNPKSLLGKLLKAARQQGPHRTQDALAEAAGIERSGLTRMESGERVPHLATLNEILTAAEVTGLARLAVEYMWRLARRADDPATVQVAPWFDAEAKAHMLRYWQCDVCPGILQTERYAYELYRVGGCSHERALEEVAGRMQRQRILEREDAPTAVVVLDEIVLRRLIGSPEIMHEQCAKLLRLPQSVLLHIIPSSLGANSGLGGAISLASVFGEPDALLTGGLLEDRVTVDAAQVRAASTTFERVRAVSANAMDSKDIIREGQQRWQQETATGERAATVTAVRRPASR